MAGQTQFTRFLAVWGAVVAAGVIGAVALIVGVDPYRLYNVIDLPGFNSVKPQPDRYQKQIKLSAAQKLQANVLILGNSRAELGFDPAHPALAAEGKSPFNLALAGTRLVTAREQLEALVVAGQRPATVIVGLEFLDFLVDPARVPAPRARGAVTGDNLKWQFDAVFSMASLADALKTVRLQRAADPRTMTALGFNPLLEYNKFARTEGYFSIFQQRAKQYAIDFAAKPHGLVNVATGTSDELEQLRAIIASAARSGTEVHLAIYPYHVQMLFMLERVGLGPLFEQWKAMLVAEVAAVRRAHPGARISLWDFSGFSKYQCEPIPPPGDTSSKTRWYWEAGHFKGALGDIILSRMLQDEEWQDGFGMRLEPSSMFDNKERIERERAACALSQPTLLKQAQRMVEQARRSS